MFLNLLIPVLVIGLDQLVKYWAVTDLQAMGSIPLWEGVFHLTYCENTGAAFSMFTGQRWLLLVVTVVFLGMLLWAQHYNWMQNAFGRMSLRFVIGGAIGNMICINNIVAVGATTGTNGNEGLLIRTNIIPCLLYALIVAGVVALMMAAGVNPSFM